MLTLMRTSAVALLLLVGVVPAQEGKFSLKTEEAGPPKELKEPIAKELKAEVHKIYSGDKAVAEVWLRKELPAAATPEQVKNGLTYKELKQTELIGAIRFLEDWTDYRKQAIKSGVYTLRLGVQPQDGDHAGTSPFQDFVVVIDAAKDASPATMEFKEMIDRSGKTTGTGHPGVFMLFPSTKPGAVQLASQPNNHWVLFTKQDVKVAGGKAHIGLGLTLVGHTME